MEGIVIRTYTNSVADIRQLKSKTIKIVNFGSHTSTVTRQKFPVLDWKILMHSPIDRYNY